MEDICAILTTYLSSIPGLPTISTSVPINAVKGNLSGNYLKEGIKADISLERKRIDTPFGVKFYLWLPTQEHKPPSFEQLLAGACFLKFLEDQKIKVYIHCEHGHSRSLTFAAGFLISTKEMKVNEAIDFIKAKRPQVHINPAQKKALKNLSPGGKK